MTEELKKELLKKLNDRQAAKDRALTVVTMLERNLAAVPNTPSDATNAQANAEEKVWLVGNRCVAPYYVDGLWYPGAITGLDRITGEAEVTFDGYGNTEMVKISDLIGEEEYVPDEGDVELEVGGYEDDNDLEEEEEEEENADPNVIYQAPLRSATKKIEDSPKSIPAKPSTSGAPLNAPFPSIAPPPLPSMFRDAFPAISPTTDEAMQAMLMSWYMNGYHTGYYQAIKDMESQESTHHHQKRKKPRIYAGKRRKILAINLRLKRAELAGLRVSKVTGSSTSKLSQIRRVRKNIARILTVYNQTQKAELRKLYAGKKYKPLDLRHQKTRAQRRALTKHEVSLKTAKQAKKQQAFPIRKYARLKIYFDALVSNSLKLLIDYLFRKSTGVYRRKKQNAKDCDENEKYDVKKQCRKAEAVLFQLFGAWCSMDFVAKNAWIPVPIHVVLFVGLQVQVVANVIAINTPYKDCPVYQLNRLGLSAKQLALELTWVAITAAIGGALFLLQTISDLLIGISSKKRDDSWYVIEGNEYNTNNKRNGKRTWEEVDWSDEKFQVDVD
ncbi:unnamed protein product, partial [Mesorhabditis belari]|uniref:Large ribosomal subunit protein uL29 n=1 Tax=Mesorhabditis belari TaxID=2138241 RepID=A0AAF3F295_9BILA